MERKVEELEEGIIKLKQIEEALRVSEEKFNFIIENSMMPMIIASLKDYTVIFYNHYATEFFLDISPAGTIKASDYWVRPSERDAFIRILKEKGSVHGYRAELKTRDNRNKWCLLSAKIISYLGQPASFVMFHDITDLRRSEEERERLIDELTTALSNVKQLSGLLPICSSCKKIRNDKGYWEQLEGYIKERSEANFSHSICPECAIRLYPELCKKNE